MIVNATGYEFFWYSVGMENDELIEYFVIFSNYIYESKMLKGV